MDQVFQIQKRLKINKKYFFENGPGFKNKKRNMKIIKSKKFLRKNHNGPGFKNKKHNMKIIKSKKFLRKNHNGPGFRISNTLPPTLVILYDIKYCNLKMDQVVPSRASAHLS